MSTEDLELLADRLYEECGDDDIVLAQLMKDLDTDVAIQLCTSDLTNALQAYIYAFDEIPDDDIYEKLLLEPSSHLIYGVKMATVELAEIIMGFDQSSRIFFIGVWNGESILAIFTGSGSYDSAVSYAIEHCSM